MKLISRLRTNLAAKLTLFLILALFFSLGCLTLVISVNVTRDLIHQQSTKLSLMSENNANLAKSSIERIVNKQTVVVSSIQASRALPYDLQVEHMLNIVHGFHLEETDTLATFFIGLPGVVSPSGMTLYSSGQGPGVAYHATAMLNDTQLSTLRENVNFSVMDPYTKTIDGNSYQVITVVNPIVDETGRVIGLLGSDISVDTINSVPYVHGDYDSFYNLIICGHDSVISNTLNADTIGKRYQDAATSANPALVLNVAKEGKEKIFLDVNTDGTRYYRACVPFYIADSKTVWISATSVTEADFVAPIEKQLAIVIGIGLLTLIVFSLLIFLSLRRNFKPIKEMELAAKAMSEGNLGTKITHQGYDEIGRLADSLRNSMAILRGYISDIDRAMGEMSRDNFDLAPTQPFEGDFKGIEDSITRFISSISNAMYRVNESSQHVSDSSGQLSNASQLLAAGAAEQAGSVEELSSTIDQITSQIRLNARHSNEAKTQTDLTGQQLEESNRKMQQMMVAMDAISAKSSEIGKIVKTIDDIAFQTNILALNAAVEAARAGTAGKGFAVVADEVRNLAGKSAEAAKTTTALIEETVQAVENGTRMMDDTAQTLNGVLENAQRVTTLIADITQATTAQATSIESINEGVHNISQVIQNNSATAQESAATAQELNGQSELLQGLVAKFQIKEALVTL